MATIAVIHGLGGTGATVRPLADLLATAGHDVRVITLPGHGSSAESLVGVGWSDWLAAIPPVEVLIGQSMGASLALAAASGSATSMSGVRLVVAINPPMADPDALEGLQWRQSRGHDWIDGPELAEGEEGSTRLPVTALIEMVEGVLALDPASVTVPALMVRGALDDSADPVALAAFADHLGGPVTSLVLPASGHVATLGPDLPLLVDAIADLL